MPLVGKPLVSDQWFNSENYELYKIDINMDMETLTDDTFRDAIETVIRDESYRKNIKLRSMMRDGAQTALQRAVRWTEHVLRHGGAHLRAPAANMHWTEYYELDLIAVLCILIACIILMSYFILVAISRIYSRLSKMEDVRWKIK